MAVHSFHAILADRKGEAKETLRWLNERPVRASTHHNGALL